MKTEIDFQSTTRFEMSVGIILLTISIILFRYLFINSLGLLLDHYSLVMLIVVISSFILFFLYFYFGLHLIKKGYNGLKESEGLAKKLRFEQMVNQILDQDLKLINIKLKQIEYNEKVTSLKEKDKSTSLGIQELNTVQYRDIKGVVAQALDANFYEKTYPEIVKNITKKSKDDKVP